MSGRLTVNVEREGLRNALLVLLNAISEDKDALSLIVRDPQAFKQAIVALEAESLSPYFRELLLWFDRRLPEHCRTLEERPMKSFEEVLKQESQMRFFDHVAGCWYILPGGWSTQGPDLIAPGGCPRFGITGPHGRWFVTGRKGYYKSLGNAAKVLPPEFRPKKDSGS